MFRLLTGCWLAFFACFASAASFDCTKSKIQIEKLICSNDELSELDTHLGNYYRRIQSTANAEIAASIRTTQRGWLKLTRSSCTNVPCLKAAYESRLDELRKSGIKDDDFDPEEECDKNNMPRGGSACDGFLMDGNRVSAENEATVAYNKLIEILPADYDEVIDLPTKERMVQFHKAWKDFEEQFCALYGELRGGASVWKSVYSIECKAGISSEQAKLLRGLYECAKQGLGGGACAIPGIVYREFGSE